MKKINLTAEELETMSYDDIAYLILENKKSKMKIQDLFKEVIELMNLSENIFEEHLADFFELLSTDKRFIMLEKGYWDLKINHSTKIVIDDDDDDEEIIDDEPIVEKEETDDEEINYDEDIVDDDDTEDDLQDLIVMDDPEDESEI